MRVKLLGIVVLGAAGIGSGAPAPATACAVIACAVAIVAVAIQGGTRLLRALFFVPPRPQPAGRHQERNEPDDRIPSPTEAGGTRR